jgi:hypothetical protein
MIRVSMAARGCRPRRPPVGSATSLAACAALTAFSGCETVPPWSPSSAQSPDDVVQAIVYPGPVRPLTQVATLYAFDGGEGAEAGWICAVDGHALLRRTAAAVHCPAVVYVAPGAHVVAWHSAGAGNRAGNRAGGRAGAGAGARGNIRADTRADIRGIDRAGTGGLGNARGTGTLRVQAMPGGVYRLVPDAARGTMALVAVRPGGVLRYADINPRFATTALPYPPAQ